MSRFVTVKKLSEMTGYSVKAINNKIDRGVWPKNKVWLHAPDGRRLIDIEGYESWATGQELESYHQLDYN